MPGINITRRPDAISDVLSLIRMRGEFVCATDFYAPWGVSFDRPVGYFHIVERGSIWLTMQNTKPQRVDAGDMLVLPLGTEHTLQSSINARTIPVATAFNETAPRDGHAYRIGGDGDLSQVICGQFSFSGVLAPKLLKVLPPMIHLVGSTHAPLEWLQLTARYLVEETRQPSPGSAIIIERLLDLFFFQVIRTWAARSSHASGWLSGLTDPYVARALAAMHENPASDWTLAQLAKVAGLSRSAFASRFTATVGVTPLKYLASWRLNLVADHLRARTASIAEIANLVGYGSEAALSRAFKAQFGVSPATFRRA
jgi:AraC-like DNA-binding protein